MPIPNLNEDGLLPEGIYEATLSEVRERFGIATQQRVFLMGQLILALTNLYQSGVKRVWINGSFVTSKENPNDIDGCWEYLPNIDLSILDPVFLQTAFEIKKKYHMDFYPSGIFVGRDWTIFFQQDKHSESGKSKGIISINLSLEAELKSFK